VEPLLIAVVVTALFFDYTNGFHDAANAVATSISTRALPPNVALAGAAVLNVVGALISTKVAATWVEMSAPTTFSTAAPASATFGGSARVEIDVATAFAASWNPFV
jgi:phosphate/sulfate permease